MKTAEEGNKKTAHEERSLTHGRGREGLVVQGGQERRQSTEQGSEGCDKHSNLRRLQWPAGAFWCILTLLRHKNFTSF